MLHEVFDSDKPRRRELALIGLGMAVALVFVGVFDPADSSFFPKCYFHKWTGLHCAGCGATRAVHQALHGRLLHAARLNVLLVLLSPWLAYELLSDLFVVARGRPLPRWKMHPVLVKGLIALVVGFWILRNVPVYPLTLLAPQ